MWSNFKLLNDQRALKHGLVCLQECFSFLRMFSETFSRTISGTFSGTFLETFSRMVSETFSRTVSETLLQKRSYKRTEPVPLEYTFMWNIKGAWYTPLVHVHIPLKTDTRKPVFEVKNDLTESPNVTMALFFGSLALHTPPHPFYHFYFPKHKPYHIDASHAQLVIFDFKH